MRKLVFALSVLTLLAATVAAQSPAGQRFDGNWLMTLTCPPKGNTEGYTMYLRSIIQNSNFRGEHGAPGEPGYLLIEGKIAQDGSAKLAANGVVASREYARGAFAHKGEDYSYEVKAQFKESEGTGVRNAGLGIVGRPCTFEFTKQQTTNPAGEH